MRDTQQSMQKARLLRTKTQELLTRLQARAHDFKLPIPEEEYAHVQKRLDQNQHLVLVMGEAKRGKSTFINAMLGRDLLPVGEEVTTSQVFRVFNAPHAEFRLRFEDGSVRAISEDELTHYGSQVEADRDTLPDSRDVLRWIEVDQPAPFLPEGVALLDTPGLGALYQEHKLLVQRYVPQADAVIFVLDSESPILETELAILETVYSVTPDIFFIQTKTDMKNLQVWQDIHRRNEEILAERFDGRLRDTRVWPIGSGLVRKAATEDDEAYLKVSRFRELEAALQAFLFRVAGWGRIADALVAADNFQQAGTPILTHRLTTISQESQQKRAEIQQTAKARRQQFETEYGENSENRRTLQTGLQRAVALGRTAIVTALNPGGTIEMEIRRLVEATHDVDDVRTLTENMGGLVTEKALAQWSQICQKAQNRCAELTGPFRKAGGTLMRMGELAVEPVSGDIMPPLPGSPAAPILEGGTWSRIKGARMELVTAGTLAGLVVALVPAAWPFAAMGALGALIGGWRNTARHEHEASQQRAMAHLGTILQSVRAYFLNVDQAGDRYSLVDEYFDNLRTVTTEYVDSMVKQKLQEAQEEIARLDEMVMANEQTRKEGVEQAQQQMVVWTALGTSVQNAVGELLALQQEFAPPNPASPAPPPAAPMPAQAVA